MNWRPWLYGLGAAIIGGGATSVTAAISGAIVAPESFNLHGGGLKVIELMITTFMVAGAMHAFAYLSQSPLPAQTITAKISVTEKVTTTNG